MNRARVVSVAVLLVAGLLLPAIEGNPARAPVEVTYIANEGFLIQAGTSRLLIDALHRGAVKMYAGPTPEMSEAMEGAKGEFAGVDLILVSHFHGDHFNAESVARHVRADPRARLVSSPQVVDSVREVTGGVIHAESAYPEVPDRARFKIGGIDLQIFRLAHGTGRFASIQNLGQIFTLGGNKFLHVGDAEIIADNFSAHRLAEDKIDYAFLPYWFLTDAEGRKIVRDLINPRHVIAMHIPPADLQQEKEKVLAAFPDAIVFAAEGERKSF